MVCRRRNDETMRSCGGCFGGVIVENGEVLMAAHITSNKAVKLVFAPAILLAGVNLTAESAPEPPRGGEHGAGATCLNKKTPFAESRN